MRVCVCMCVRACLRVCVSVFVCLCVFKGVTLLYTYNVVLTLITEVQWWEIVSNPELMTSTLNKADPKKTRREKFGST